MDADNSATPIPENELSVSQKTEQKIKELEAQLSNREMELADIRYRSHKTQNRSLIRALKSEIAQLKGSLMD